MFSSIDQFKAVPVVVAELENTLQASRLNQNFLRGNVLDIWWGYHVFDYCCIVRFFYHTRYSSYRHQMLLEGVEPWTFRRMTGVVPPHLLFPYNFILPRQFSVSP